MQGHGTIKISLRLVVALSDEYFVLHDIRILAFNEKMQIYPIN